MTTLEDMTKKKAEPSAEAAARAIRSQNAALRPCSVTTTGRCSWFQGERLREDRIPVPRTRLPVWDELGRSGSTRGSRA